MFGIFGLAELVIVFAVLVGITLIVLRKNDRRETERFSAHSHFAGHEQAPLTTPPAQRDTTIKGPHQKFCQECGAIIRAKAEICPQCGVRQAVTSGSGRSRVGAALFALFLGWFGIHKFYLGKVGQGVLYLLFCGRLFLSSFP